MILIELNINEDCETSKEHEQTDSNQKYEDLTGRLFHHPYFTFLIVRWL